MNNKKMIKIIFSTIITIACLFIFHTMSQAASFDASISKTSVTVGDTFTVTVKANNAAGMYSVTSSNSNVSINSGSGSEFLENGSATITFKAEKVGSATITAEATDMTDLDDDTKAVTGSKTFSITVKAASSENNNDSNSSGGNNTNTNPTPTFTSKNETVYATDDGINVRSSCTTSVSNNILGSLSKGESLKRTGIATKAIDGITWSKVTYNGKTAYVTSAYLSTTKPVVDTPKDTEDDKKDENTTTEKSSNKKLKSLTVTELELTPEFNPNTTEYTMTVGSDIDTVKIEAIAEDEKAKVEITGNKNLKVGENTISIKVTAEDKTVRTYKIIVTKEKEAQIKLKELEIEGLTLSPEFNSTTYEYEVTIENEDTKELNITATPSKEKAEVEIVGNKDLKVGENTITIIVKSSDGKETATYQINANIKEAKPVVATNNSGSDLYKYIAIGVVLAIICIAGIIMLSKRKKDDDIDYETSSENDNDNGNEENNIIEELPKLDDEDLPKYLRKKNIEGNDLEQEEKSERSKRIDEFYANSGRNSSETKRGKHF